MPAEKASLYAVTEPTDRPASKLIGDSSAEVRAQFNPASLKVSLANSLRENERSGNSRAAQYVDKSSSNLSVELLFDSTEDARGGDGAAIDVRRKTAPIARTFMHSEAVGNQSAEPQRCMFAWGSFFFVGIMESFEETLEFFSPEGVPLRATVSLKLSESRFQFRTEEAISAERDTPTVDDTSNSAAEANSAAGKDPKEWRDTAQHNGVESPRDTSDGPLSVPPAGSGANGDSSSVGGGIPGAFPPPDRPAVGEPSGASNSPAPTPSGVGFD